MRKLALLFLALHVLLLASAHFVRVLDYDGEVLKLSLSVLYTPATPVRVVLITQHGFVLPREVEGNVYEFVVGKSDYAIVSVQGFSEEYGVMKTVVPWKIDLATLAKKPQLHVISDFKGDRIYKYVRLTFDEKWKLKYLVLDGEKLDWFRWNGGAVAWFDRDIKSGEHTLIALFELPYGLKKRIVWKLFSFEGVLVKFRGGTFPYEVELLPPYYHVVRRGETLWGIANEYGVRLGDLVLINSIENPDYIKAGQVVKIGRVKFEENPITIVVNLFTARMGVYYDGRLLKVYPVALGRSDTTPPGKYWILRKVINPALYWYGEYIPPDTPINGLGTRYLQLSNPQYAIHGTSKPWEIGKRISHGCIRMFNEDVEELDAFAAVGSIVWVVKAGGMFPRTLEEALRWANGRKSSLR